MSEPTPEEVKAWLRDEAAYYVRAVGQTSSNNLREFYLRESNLFTQAADIIERLESALAMHGHKLVESTPGSVATVMEQPKR